MKKAMLLFVSLMLSAGANAAHFDFAAMADAPNGLPPVFTNSEGLFTSATDGGVTVTASGTADNGQTKANPYLDASGSQGPAGLGVCKVLDNNNCNPGSDDNILAGEELVLEFDKTVKLGLVDFQNGKHANTFTGTFTLGVFNGSWVYTAGLALQDMIDFGETGSMFSFLNTSAGSTSGDQFYIRSLNAEVPVPAALFLFAPALLGFLGLRRKASVAA